MNLYSKLLRFSSCLPIGFKSRFGRLALMGHAELDVCILSFAFHNMDALVKQSVLIVGVLLWYMDILLIIRNIIHGNCCFGYLHCLFSYGFVEGNLIRF